MQQTVFPFYQEILDQEAEQARLNKIPYFIRQRGCINCDIYATFRKEGYSHETTIGCVVLGCFQVGWPKQEDGGGHYYASPFIDPEWAVNRARKEGDPSVIDKAIAYARKIFQIFRDDYEYLGISLTDLIDEEATN